MSNPSITVTVYQRKRRLGTKGRSKGPGHAKSVTKLKAELELGESLFNEKDESKKKKSESSSNEDATIKVAVFKDCDPKQAVLFLDRFEKQTDNLAFCKKVARYTQRKAELLAEYGVKSQADLTEAARVRVKKELSKMTFYYYEYQTVVEYGDKRKVHSHRMKLVSRRPEDSWSLPKIEDSESETANEETT